MNIIRIRPSSRQGGFTLVEAMMAVLILVIFFASLFELNAMCLRFMNSGKEALAALQSVQDRLETLRNRNFVDLTKTDCSTCTPVPPATECTTIPCVRILLASAANPAPISQRFTEVVTISNYPPTANGVTQFTRLPDGSVTTNSLRADPLTNLAKVDVSVSWPTTVGGRTRTEQTSCIVANGSKK